REDRAVHDEQVRQAVSAIPRIEHARRRIGPEPAGFADGSESRTVARAPHTDGLEWRQHAAHDGTKPPPPLEIGIAQSIAHRQVVASAARDLATRFDAVVWRR